MSKTEEEQRLIEQRLTLEKRANEVVNQYPEVDRDDVIHTLILLQRSPLQRLINSLRRGRRIRNII